MTLDLHRYHVDQAPWADRGPDVTMPAERVAVIVTTRWRDGYVAETQGWARAWTPRAVLVSFGHPDGGVGQYPLWLPVADVRRPDQ